MIVELTLKVRPRPEASAIVCIPLSTADEVSTALDRLNTSGTRPMAIELLNRPAARHLGGPLGLPDSSFVLAIGYEDNLTSVTWQTDRLAHELSRPGIVIARDESAAPLWTALTEFQADELGPFTIMANLRPSSVGRFVGGLEASLWSCQSHAGNGIVRAHWIGEPNGKTVAQEVDRLRAISVGDGGNLVLTRCPLEAVETLRIWGEPRVDWALAGRIKHALDPSGLMNPGRFVGNL